MCLPFCRSLCVNVPYRSQLCWQCCALGIALRGRVLPDVLDCGQPIMFLTCTVLHRLLVDIVPWVPPPPPTS